MKWTATSTDGWSATIEAGTSSDAWREAINRHAQWADDPCSDADLTVTPEPTLPTLELAGAAPTPQGSLW